MRYKLMLALAALMAFFAQSAFAATVPQITSAMGRELDRQVVERLQQADSPARGVSLSITTPVDLDNLEYANTLARQVQEEIARWFVQAGYQVQEIRKGADVLFEPTIGEMLLTRRNDLLSTNVVSSQLIAMGTYTVTTRNVRFNIRLMETATQEVVAMSTMTIPLTSEIAGLLGGGGSGNGGGGTPIIPVVYTLLP